MSKYDVKNELQQASFNRSIQAASFVGNLAISTVNLAEAMVGLNEKNQMLQAQEDFENNKMNLTEQYYAQEYDTTETPYNVGDDGQYYDMSGNLIALNDTDKVEGSVIVSRKRKNAADTFTSKETFLNNFLEENSSMFEGKGKAYKQAYVAEFNNWKANKVDELTKEFIINMGEENKSIINEQSKRVKETLGVQGTSEINRAKLAAKTNGGESLYKNVDITAEEGTKEYAEQKAISDFFTGLNLMYETYRTEYSEEEARKMVESEYVSAAMYFDYNSAASIISDDLKITPNFNTDVYVASKLDAFTKSPILAGKELSQLEKDSYTNMLTGLVNEKKKVFAGGIEVGINNAYKQLSDINSGATGDRYFDEEDVKAIIDNVYTSLGTTSDVASQYLSKEQSLVISTFNAIAAENRNARVAKEALELINSSNEELIKYAEEKGIEYIQTIDGVPTHNIRKIKEAIWSTLTPEQQKLNYDSPYTPEIDFQFIRPITEHGSGYLLNEFGDYNYIEEVQNNDDYNYNIEQSNKYYDNAIEIQQDISVLEMLNSKKAILGDEGFNSYLRTIGAKGGLSDEAKEILRVVQKYSGTNNIGTESIESLIKTAKARLGEYTNVLAGIDSSIAKSGIEKGYITKSALDWEDSIIGDSKIGNYLNPIRTALDNYKIGYTNNKVLSENTDKNTKINYYSNLITEGEASIKTAEKNITLLNSVSNMMEGMDSDEFYNIWSVLKNDPNYKGTIETVETVLGGTVFSNASISIVKESLQAQIDALAEEMANASSELNGLDETGKYVKRSKEYYKNIAKYDKDSINEREAIATTLEGAIEYFNISAPSRYLDNEVSQYNYNMMGTLDENANKIKSRLEDIYGRVLSNDEVMAFINKWNSTLKKYVGDNFDSTSLQMKKDEIDTQYKNTVAYVYSQLYEYENGQSPFLVPAVDYLYTINGGTDKNATSQEKYNYLLALASENKTLKTEQDKNEDNQKNDNVPNIEDVPNIKDNQQNDNAPNNEDVPKIEDENEDKQENDNEPNIEDENEDNQQNDNVPKIENEPNNENENNQQNEDVPNIGDEPINEDNQENEDVPNNENADAETYLRTLLYSLSDEQYENAKGWLKQLEAADMKKATKAIEDFNKTIAENKTKDKQALINNISSCLSAGITPDLAKQILISESVGINENDAIQIVKEANSVRYDSTSDIWKVIIDDEEIAGYLDTETLCSIVNNYIEEVTKGNPNKNALSQNIGRQFVSYLYASKGQYKDADQCLNTFKNSFLKQDILVKREIDANGKVKGKIKDLSDNNDNNFIKNYAAGGEFYTTFNSYIRFDNDANNLLFNTIYDTSQSDDTKIQALCYALAYNYVSNSTTYSIADINNPTDFKKSIYETMLTDDYTLTAVTRVAEILYTGRKIENSFKKKTDDSYWVDKKSNVDITFSQTGFLLTTKGLNGATVYVKPTLKNNGTSTFSYYSDKECSTQINNNILFGYEGMSDGQLLELKVEAASKMAEYYDTQLMTKEELEEIVKNYKNEPNADKKNALGNKTIIVRQTNGKICTYKLEEFVSPVYYGGYSYSKYQTLKPSLLYKGGSYFNSASIVTDTHKNVLTENENKINKWMASDSSKEIYQPSLYSLTTKTINYKVVPEVKTAQQVVADSNSTWFSDKNGKKYEIVNGEVKPIYDYDISAEKEKKYLSIAKQIAEISLNKVTTAEAYEAVCAYYEGFNEVIRVSSKEDFTVAAIYYPEMYKYFKEGWWYLE